MATVGAENICGIEKPTVEAKKNLKCRAVITFTYCQIVWGNTTHTNLEGIRG